MSSINTSVNTVPRLLQRTGDDNAMCQSLNSSTVNRTHRQTAPSATQQPLQRQPFFITTQPPNGLATCRREGHASLVEPKELEAIYLKTKLCIEVSRRRRINATSATPIARSTEELLLQFYPADEPKEWFIFYQAMPMTLEQSLSRCEQKCSFEQTLDGSI